MGTRLATAGAAALLTFIVTTASAIAADAHKLARSSELGIEIYAEGGEGWCRQRLGLTVRAKDAGVFETSGFEDLFKKLGQVLETECPAAHHAAITGLDAEGEPSFEGNADASNGWVLSRTQTIDIDALPPVEEVTPPEQAPTGRSWTDSVLAWLTTILEWASALRPQS